MVFEAEGCPAMPLIALTGDRLIPGAEGRFVVPFGQLNGLLNLVDRLPSNRFSMAISNNAEVLVRIPGRMIEGAVKYLRHVSEVPPK